MFIIECQQNIITAAYVRMQPNSFHVHVLLDVKFVMFSVCLFHLIMNLLMIATR